MIEVNTLLDINAQKKLSRFMIKNALLKPFFIITWAAVLLMGIGFLVLGLTIESDIDFLFFGKLLLYFILGMSLFLALIFILSSKSTNKSAKYLHQPQAVYFRFDNDSIFSQSSQNGVVTSNATVPYFQLFKAHEDKTDFYLFISNAVAYVVPKSDFSTGQPQDLRQLLHYHLGPKKFISKP